MQLWAEGTSEQETLQVNHLFHKDLYEHSCCECLERRVGMGAE